MSIVNLVSDFSFSVLFCYVMYQVNKQLGSFFKQVGVDSYRTNFLGFCIIFYFILLMCGDLITVIGLLPFEWVDTDEFGWTIDSIWDVCYLNDLVFNFIGIIGLTYLLDSKFVHKSKSTRK